MYTFSFLLSLPLDIHITALRGRVGEELLTCCHADYCGRVFMLERVAIFFPPHNCSQSGLGWELVPQKRKDLYLISHLQPKLARLATCRPQCSLFQRLEAPRMTNLYMTFFQHTGTDFTITSFKTELHPHNAGGAGPASLFLFAVKSWRENRGKISQGESLLLNIDSSCCGRMWLPCC